MIRLIKPLVLWLWVALLVLVIGAGIFVGAARLTLPAVSQYRNQLAAMAAEQIGRPVRIGSLRASWRGLGPQLLLEDVAVLDSQSGAPLLQLAQIRVGLSVLDSLRSGRLSPSRLTLAGARLLVKRRSDGSVTIAGLENLEGSEGRARGPLRLPPRVELRQGEVWWENQAIGGHPMRFHDVDLGFLSDGERYQLDGSLGLPGAGAGRMTLAADITGALNRAGGWVADVYLRGERMPMQQLLRDRLPAGYAFGSGAAQLEIWSHWEHGRLSRVAGRVGLADMLFSGPDQRQLVLPRAGGRFRWQRLPTGWRLDAADIEVQRGDHLWPRSTAAMVSELDPHGRARVRFGADFLRVEDILAVVGMFPVPDNRFTQALRVASPAGDIRDLRVQYRETAGRPLWSAEGGVVGLKAGAWEKAPGVSALDARFWADQDGGRAELDSESLSVDMPRLFRWPLDVDRLTGQVRWQRAGGGGWRISAPDITASNADIRTRTRFSLDLPLLPDVSPVLDLQTDFYDGDASKAGIYYPTGIMGPKLVGWLDRAVVSGRVVSGGVIVRGPLREFPFHRTFSGRFEVQFGVEDLVLDYHDQWPRLEGTTADVRFLNNSFDARVYTAGILSGRVLEAQARIDSLRPVTPLQVRGRVSSSVSDDLRLLSETPLQKTFRQLTDAVRGSGPTELSIDLRLPLASQQMGNLKLDGTLSFQGASLGLAGWDLLLEGLQGDVRFSEASVQARGVKAKTLGSQVKIDVETPTEGPPRTRIKARGQLDSQVLLERASAAGLAEPEGRADWLVTLDLPRKEGQSTPAHLRLESDLKGVVLGLPAPLGKSADSERPIRVGIDLVDSGPYPLDLSYGQLLDGRFLLRRDADAVRLLRGALCLGGCQASMPSRDGLVLSGRLDELDVSPWLDYGARQLQARADEAGTGVSAVDLQVGRLRYGEALELRDAQAALTASGEALSGPIESRRLKGFLSVPRSLKASPIQARLEYLDLDFAAPDTLDPSDRPPSDADPRDFPGLDLAVSHLRVNQTDLGPLTVLATRIPEGLRLRHLDLDSEQLHAHAEGHWTGSPPQGPRSQVDFSLETHDPPQLLSALGFSPNVKAKTLKLEGTLAWPGSPADPDRRSIDGKLDMSVGEGQFLELEPGVGRVFGLLSLGTLQRRLSLDFTDLVGKGLSFDKIRGSFALKQGNAFTDDLMIQGPSARLDLAGRIGLVSEDFDQLVTVTPELTSSLPVAGAIAGGPAVGAALLVAQKLMGDKVDRIGRYRFTVSGPWSDPKVEKLARGEPGTPSGAAAEAVPVQPRADRPEPSPKPAPAPQ